MSVLLMCAVLAPAGVVRGQYVDFGLKKMHFTNPKRKKIQIPFQLVHNLILITGSINDSEPLTFILDSGVGYTMLTGLHGNQSISLKYARQIKLHGLGEGEPIDALHSTLNQINLPGGVTGQNQDIIIPVNDIFQISQSLGVNVNGILGYDVFSSFIVDIDYEKRVLTLHNPYTFRPKKTKKSATLPIEILNRKPYTTFEVQDINGNQFPVRLIVDSGASHAVSLYPQTNEQIQVPPASIRAFLGMGLSGDIYGSVGRLSGLQVGNFRMDAPICTYPDEDAVRAALDVQNRNGSLGADVLKRYRVIFDYFSQELIFYPNKNFQEPFRYNMAGIEIASPMPGLPVYQIAKVRENSPAVEAGLQKGDQIVGINGMSIAQYSLNQIIELFQSKPGRLIKISVIRNNQDRLEAKFRLQDPIMGVKGEK